MLLLYLVLLSHTVYIHNADINDQQCHNVSAGCQGHSDSDCMANNGGTCKQHASSEHLSQYTASGPHVYGLGIVVGGQEQTRGTIPLSYQTL